MSQPDDITPEEAEKLENQIETGSNPAEGNPSTPPPAEETPMDEGAPPVVPEIPGLTAPANP